MIEYGLVERDDLQAAAAIYVESFPHRASQWFSGKREAVRAYADLLDLMRIVHGSTFLVARDSGQLIGYLVLAMPGHSALNGLLRDGFALRVGLRALAGRYGWPGRFVLRALGAPFQLLTHRENDSIERQLEDSPHVYILAVVKGYTGRGIGATLIEQARAKCAGRYSRMWLFVERENAGAIRFYQRIGFRIDGSDSKQHAMVWDFNGALAG